MIAAVAALMLGQVCLPTPPPPGATDDPTPPVAPPPDDIGPDPTVNGSISGRLTVQSDGDAAATGGTRLVVPLIVADAGPIERLAAVDAVAAGELIVTFDDTVSSERRRELLAEAGMDLLECSPACACRATVEPYTSEHASDSKADRLQRATRDAAGRLEGVPGIRGAESNPRRYVTRAPNDVYYPHQWHYELIHLPEAWDLTVGSDEVIVAVIDTGILSGHPDLQGRLVAGYDFIADPVSARDGDGRDADPEDPGDLLGGPGQSSFHGTHVAGIVAATTDNVAGVAGVTWRTRVMPLRALGVDGGTAFDVAEAIRYAAGLPNVTGTLPSRPADVINLSLVGAPGEAPSTVEIDALKAAAGAGVLIVAAAGNAGSSLPAYPAAAAEAISVSAVEIQLQLASYSNYGATIDLAAPGGFTGADLNGDGFADGVLSTGASDLDGRITYQYVFSAGTSMAAPHVAAGAALVRAANPALTAVQIREVLESTARDLGSAGRDDFFGHGLIDAAAAVREAFRLAGVEPTATAELALSSNLLDFGLDRNELTVQVRNTAGQPLALESVTSRTLAGTGWLSAEAEPVPAGASIATIAIRVDRTALPDGLYLGTVTIAAAGLGAARVDVRMEAGPAAAGETIYILAVDPASLDTVGQAVTTGSADYRYTIADLPEGPYLLYAGTDRDDNGYICEEGDLCGALPSRLEPRVLALGAGENLTGADFSVARLVLQQMAVEPASTHPLRRMPY